MRKNATILFVALIAICPFAGCPHSLLPPVANFGFDPERGRVPMLVTFSDLSEPGTSTISTWHWDFGDGTTSAAQNPRHTYERIGKYTVSLTIQSSVGSDTISLHEAITTESPCPSIVIKQEGTDTTYMLPGDTPMTLASIPAGTFQMGQEDGTDDEQPVHEVTISQDFLLGRTEITKSQWFAVMGNTPWEGLSDVSDHPDSPAVYITWQDANQFVLALSELTCEPFRLPTEAEWEYATRSGTTTPYFFGENVLELADFAWWAGNAVEVGEPYAHEVALLSPNPWGLFDVYGNALEWCQDSYDASYYAVSPAIDPLGPAAGRLKVFRGGSYGHEAESTMSAVRFHSLDNVRAPTLGFRVALDLTP